MKKKKVDKRPGFMKMKTPKIKRVNHKMRKGQNERFYGKGT